MVAMSSITWKENITSNLSTMAERVGAAVLMKANTLSPKIAAWMKENHPWTNRTGFAQMMLDTSVEQMGGDTIRIWMYNNKPYYGPYLESRWGGRYSVLRPAIQYWRPKLLSEMEGLFDELQRLSGV